MKAISISLPKMLIALSITLLVNETKTLAQSKHSTADGKWEDPATWVESATPIPGDSVLIYHTVRIDAITPDANIMDIEFIQITNTGSQHAILNISQDKRLNVRTNVDVIGTNNDFDTELNISGDLTQVDIDGDLTFTDQNTFDRHVFLFMDVTPTLNVLGNFSFTKLANPAGGETFNEVVMGGSVDSAPIFTIGGDLTLYYNLNDLGYLRFQVNYLSSLTATNLNIISAAASGGTPAAPDVDIVLDVFNSANVVIGGTTTLDFDYDLVNDQHENQIRTWDNSHFQTQNLVMISRVSSGTINNYVRTYNTSLFEITGDVSFTRAGVGTSDNRIETNNDSQLILYGAMNNSNSNSWTFNNTSTFELAGTGIQTLPDPTSNTFRNLIMNNSSGTPIALPDAATVNGALTLTNGIITTTSSTTLTIANGGSSSSGSNISHVDGPMAKIGTTDFIFPVGDNGFWQPIGVSNISSITRFTAQYFETTPVNNLSLRSPDPNGDLQNVSGLEYWTLTSSASPVTSNVTLYWEDDTRSGITSPVDLRIAHYSGSNEWENFGNSGYIDSSPTGSVTSTSISSYGSFTFGSSANNALPVNLISFEGSAKSNAVELTWETTHEENNDFFEIQRSIDGNTFKSIGNVKGNNNSNESEYYYFNDNLPVNGIQYYRLKQVDFDGAYQYSRTIIVSYQGNSNLTPFVFPNPSEGDFLTLIVPGEEELVSVSILDKAGKRFLTQYSQISNDQYQVSVSNFPKGVYIIQIETSNSLYTEKIIRK